MSGQKYIYTYTYIYNIEYLDDEADGDDKRIRCRDFGCK